METIYLDTFDSGVGVFRTSFTIEGCELRYPNYSGRRIFETRQEAHSAIGFQLTGFLAWDDLPRAVAIERAWLVSRWGRAPIDLIEPGDEPLRAGDFLSSPRVPPTAPPQNPRPTAS